MQIKYPRTYHLPFSMGISSDDKIIDQSSLSNFYGKDIIVLEKMDGENTTMTADKIYARSLDTIDHFSRHYVKGVWGNIKHEIPDGWRICGENVWAKHSIHYNNLEDYFLVFNVWNENNECLSYSDTLLFCNMLELKMVPCLWQGIFDLKTLENIANELSPSIQEGFVIRLSNSFYFNEFNKSVAKYVRANHVTSNIHWMKQKIIKNNLINE